MYSGTRGPNLKNSSFAIITVYNVLSFLQQRSAEAPISRANISCAASFPVAGSASYGVLYRFPSPKQFQKKGLVMVEVKERERERARMVGKSSLAALGVLITRESNLAIVTGKKEKKTLSPIYTCYRYQGKRRSSQTK